VLAVNYDETLQTYLDALRARFLRTDHQRFNHILPHGPAEHIVVRDDLFKSWRGFRHSLLYADRYHEWRYILRYSQDFFACRINLDMNPLAPIYVY